MKGTRNLGRHRKVQGGKATPLAVRGTSQGAYFDHRGDKTGGGCCFFSRSSSVIYRKRDTDGRIYIKEGQGYEQGDWPEQQHESSRG